MKTSFFLSVLFLLFSPPVSGDDLNISIYTLEPGENIYSTFGHAAIRIQDMTEHSDKVYNFGTFNFDDPYFYFKFIKGNLNYFLSVVSTSDFVKDAETEKRILYEQQFDLSAKEKILLRENLELCYNSPQRFYKYDFFYNNCATKIRDFVSNASETPLRYDTGENCDKSFRQLIRPYIVENYWLSLGINLLLGPASDRKADCYEQMFLPEYIKEMVKISGLSIHETLIYKPENVQNRNFVFSWLPAYCITILLLIFSLYRKTRKFIFNVTCLVTGITGLLIILISLLSENKIYSDNLNILWTVPALMVIMFPGRNFRKIFKLVYLLLLVSIMILWPVLPQQLSVTFIPWMLLLIIILITDLQLLPKIFFKKSNNKS